MNAFLVKWQREEEFKNIIIHLGDFHFLKENFKVLGMLIRNSCFQDIVFCSRICTSGSFNGAYLQVAITIGGIRAVPL